MIYNLLLKENNQRRLGRKGACWLTKIMLLGQDHAGESRSCWWGRIMLEGNDHEACGRMNRKGRGDKKQLTQYIARVPHLHLHLLVCPRVQCMSRAGRRP